MRKYVRKLGHIYVLVLMTLSAVIAAEILAYAIIILFSFPYPLPSTPVVTFLVTAILTPVIAWHLLKLLFTIDKMEQKMNYLATYDSLTKVLSRQAFFERAQVIHDSFNKNNQAYTVCIIDLDDFKVVNDTYGHAGGDKVLIHFGYILNKSFNIETIIGRVGGEEFALLIPRNIDQAKILIRDLQEKISNSNLIFEDEHINITMSIGIYENNFPQSKLLDYALAMADKALYDAKSTGKDRFSIYSDLEKPNSIKPSSKLRSRQIS